MGRFVRISKSCRSNFSNRRSDTSRGHEFSVSFCTYCSRTSVYHKFHHQTTTNKVRLAESIPHNPNDVLFIGGSEDKISEPDQIARLANVGNWKFDLIEGAGHAVPIEKPIDWRNRVLSFFNEEA